MLTWILVLDIICGGSTFSSQPALLSFWKPDELRPVTGEVLAEVTGVAAELPK